jgi:hypothetical protein
VLLALLPACAWANRANRPVWNAFEDNLVPASQGAFVATLPLTVPVGLLAILTDTFVAHPIQVVDDAADDTADLWRGIDLEKRYYTDAGLMPVRAVASPIWFVGSFLGRSMFDIRSPEDAAKTQAEFEARRRSRTLEWLKALAAGGDDAPQYGPPDVLDDELRAAVAAAAAQATALGRIRLYQHAAQYQQLGVQLDWPAALGDASAVVRYRVLEVLPKSVVVPDELWEKLRNDPDEAVRALATRASKR